MARWDKRSKKAPIKLIRRKLLVLLSISCFLLPTASANVIDSPVVFERKMDLAMIRNSMGLDMFSGRPLSNLTKPVFFSPLIKTINNVEEKVVIDTLILEAAGEGYEGMVAVGEVIRNRAKFFHKGFEAVCLMPKQFSCWNDKQNAENLLKKKSDCYALAQKAWRNSEKSSLAGGATDYHAACVHPYWADAYRVVSKIGNHVFYARK